LKVIFFGSSEFSVPFLNAIYNSHHNVELVITGSDKKKGRGKKTLPNPVKESAKSLNLYFLEVDDFSNEIIENISNREFDCFILVSFGKILPEKLLSISKGKTVNFHPSILPKHRGPSPIISALIEGDAKTGISIIKMTEDVDDGDIYLIAEFAVSEEDNKDSVEEKITRIGTPLLIKVMDLIEENKITVYPQGKENISYTRLFLKKDLRIDWNDSAVKIRNKIRAFSSNPGCFTYWREKNIKILKANICRDEEIFSFSRDEYRNGTVIYAGRSGLFIKCGAKEKNKRFLNGEIIKVVTLKPQDKNFMSFLDFINGYKVKSGEIFK